MGNHMDVIHDGVTCDGCNASPIRGFRFKCIKCADYDLCARCVLDNKHSEHMMLLVRTPISHLSVDTLFEGGCAEPPRQPRRGYRHNCCWNYPPPFPYPPQHPAAAPPTAAFYPYPNVPYQYPFHTIGRCQPPPAFAHLLASARTAGFNFDTPPVSTSNCSTSAPAAADKEVGEKQGEPASTAEPDSLLANSVQPVGAEQDSVEGAASGPMDSQCDDNDSDERERAAEAAAGDGAKGARAEDFEVLGVPGGRRGPQAIADDFEGLTLHAAAQPGVAASDAASDAANVAASFQRALGEFKEVVDWPPGRDDSKLRYLLARAKFDLATAIQYYYDDVTSSCA